ncbi:response regulator [Amycolatopsis sp. NPDC057786]|uniref:response regulator n=1 Tax=Amycolatopsis sp. NPDC057786 TaxID=3346250 RepID=UPI0036733297
MRVLIADDEWMVRSMLRTIMESADDIIVTGEASDGAEAVKLTRSTRPDVVLLDIRMPRVDGLDAARRLQGLADPPKVVVLTTFDLDEYVETALRAGAVGFLLKDATAVDMLAAVRAAARGDAMLSPKITRRLLTRFTAGEPAAGLRADAERRLEVMTGKEREVLVAVARSLSNMDIAAEFHLSEATVKTHVSRILAKLGCTNRVQVALLAHRAALLD